MITISSRHNFAELIKLADFLQAENTEIFNKKFEGEDPNEIKKLADRFYFIFKPMKDYEEYRSLANSISTIEELEEFLAKCDNAISIISKKISSFGIRESGAIDMAKQFVQKYYKDLDSIVLKVGESNTKEDMFSLLRGEKKKVNKEFEGKDISGLSKDYTDWILKIFELSKAGGEAHSIDDIISLAKTFKSSEQKLEKKINEFRSYSEANDYLNDNSGVSKKVYTESIRVAAQENDMSRIVYNDDRWTVVLIGSTIGGQWWGRDTDFCISTIENNLYSNYATGQKIDPYFIIDKLAESSDPMRKFTLAIQYDESGKFKISNDSFTMTDARNTGISLDSIRAALGKDYNKVFESINRDAATREENIGTINNNKIAAKISEKDYEFIKKYEKEIITNDKLIKSILKGINNTGDAEKVKNIIKNYAEIDPYDFIFQYSNNDWAKDYLPTAAKAFIKSDSHYFLSIFADKPWAEPYIPTAAENLAEKLPWVFLRGFSKEDWAQPYLHIAAKKLSEVSPASLLNSLSHEPWAKLHIPTAAKKLAKSDPYYFLKSFINESWAQEHITTAAETYAERDPHAFLKYFINEPWAELYIPTAAKNLAESGPYYFLYSFRNQSWAEPYIHTAAKNLAEEDPLYFLKYFINEPWAETYIGSAVKSYVNKNSPHDFLMDFPIRPWAKKPREDLDGKSCNQYVGELLRKQEDEIEAMLAGLDREAYYSPRLTKLAKVLRLIGLSNEVASILNLK